jgi:threonine dehydrogenase-like Zn-dependent dehydrogenase
MKAVRLKAEWAPREGFVLGPKDIDGKLTYLGSKVWRNPAVDVEEVSEPDIADDEVLIEVKACGICGSDVHMAQVDPEGYMLYPGLTAFPVTLGHEFGGIIVDVGDNAFNKRTNKKFRKGEPVCAEEMFWCGRCRPCADGYPNHCEALEEIGFSCDGAFAPYVKLKAKYCWSLEPLKERYSNNELFLAGSLVEPTSVAYNAVVERGGGIRPGDNVAILGGGPIGLAAIAILSRAGAANVILSEPSKSRAKLGEKMGATAIIDPIKEDFAEKLLDLTDGMGAKLYLEATGLPEVVWPGIEDAIWRGRTLNSTVVIVARADAKIPLTGEVLQVRRASVVGSQGHSGHGTFPRVISAMGAGMDMTPLVTKKIGIEDVPEHLTLLQTDREECKITALL